MSKPGKWAIVPHERVGHEVQPAAFYEREAAFYIRISIRGLRDLVAQGIIQPVTHHGGVRRIYLRSDLDQYLLSRRTVGKSLDSVSSAEDNRGIGPARDASVEGSDAQEGPDH
jgi:hypothetical protein